MPPKNALYHTPEKPSGLRDWPRYLWAVICGFFYRLFYILCLVWESAPVMLVWMVLFCVLGGLLPVAGAVISSRLLNAVASLIGSTGEASVLAVLRPCLWLFVLQFAYMFLSRLLTRLNTMVSTMAGDLVSNHIRVGIIKKSMTVDQQSFDSTEFYEKLENANREAGMRPIGILNATLGLISTTISICSFVVVLSGMGAMIPLVILVASLPGAVINYLYRNRNFRYLRRHSKERREMNYYSSLMVSKDYAKEIKILGLGNTFLDKYNGVFSRYFRGQKRLVVREGLAQICVGLLSVAVHCLLFGYVAYTVITGQGLIGDYSLYTGALSSVSTYVGSLLTSTASIYEGTLFIDNLISFMNTEPTVVCTLPQPRSLRRGDAHTVEFENVSFRYPGCENYVLENINLTLQTGQRTVLVGLNGAGKTTLIKLLTRLYDPTEGRVLLDGVDIREYDPSAYQSLFGIIFQDFGRYAQTVSENIRFGDATGPYTLKRVRESADHADATDFIEALPRGFETNLSRIFEEDGVDLSGGQWQRLSLSRAFYKNSDFLILDEPTAALDPLAEAAVFRRFYEISAGKLSLFVSHRLFGAVDAEQIVVVENGRIAELGTHAQLMALGGKYHHLFTVQAGRYIGGAAEDVPAPTVALSGLGAEKPEGE